MEYKLNRVLLIDDNPNDNFYHQRIINKTGIVKEVVAKESAPLGLEYLEEHVLDTPVELDVIFLDINMPGMNGWEFLEEYKKLGVDQQAKIMVVMLTTSRRSTDQEKAKHTGVVAKYLIKPLTVEGFTNLVDEHFVD